jgi:C7-cyclitol 7-kinase
MAVSNKRTLQLPGTRSRPFLVFDIGGTSVRAGIADSATGVVCAVKRADTPNYLSHPGCEAEDLLEELVSTLSALANELLGERQPSIVIVGYPGPITASGTAMRSPTILGPILDREYDCKRRLEVVWPESDVIVLNDLTCAGFGFVARGHQDFCVITVGSGIGNKIFLTGQPITGKAFRGGEIGHLLTYPSPDSPTFKVRDELGNIASGRGTIALARRWFSYLAERFPESDLLRDSTETGPTLDIELLVQAFREQDELAVNVIEMTSYPLAMAIGCIHLALGIESFFIVGGFAKALGPGYLEVLGRNCAAMTWDVGQNWGNMIHMGDISAEEALVGAAYFASRHAGSQMQFETVHAPAP